MSADVGNMNKEVDVLIIGAGPTGLGAAWRLKELGKTATTDWLLVEKGAEAGGLSSSVVDPHGFTWDMGGHVIFSHYKYFDDVLDDLLDADWLYHQREAWVWMRDRFIPYPFQNNIWRLPKTELLLCLDDLVKLGNTAGGAILNSSDTFLDWIYKSFGSGLANSFFIPYNRKVWAYDPSTMGVGWMGERVATVDLSRVLRGVVMEQDELGWGPNAVFRFPLRGGTGNIWRTLAQRLPQELVSYNAHIRCIDSTNHIAILSDGSEIKYQHCISTVALDTFLESVSDMPEQSALVPQFVYSSTNIIGLGIDGPVRSELKTKCWMYFPEPETPFYRATVFSNYSPNHVPKPGEQWSLMLEVSESPVKKVNQKSIVQECIDGAIWSKLIDKESQIISTFYHRMARGYPTPFLGRDELLNKIQPRLRERDILSRGRFGAWKYEVSNQDHSFMQGVEAVDNLVSGTVEHTYNNLSHL
jgi:protoporphyrinogen oxidase